MASCLRDYKEKRLWKTVLPVRSRAQKFNIVSNDYERMCKSSFSAFDRKFQLQANLVKKNQTCQFKLKFGT